MALVRNYGFQSTSEDEFDFNFEIPVNCNYTTQYDATKKLYTVTVQLNSGQSTPSSTYSMQYCTFNSDNGLLEVRYDSVQNGVTTTKPKITIAC
nr:hypothetical protein [uncultured Flavobacterium sp.]